MMSVSLFKSFFKILFNGDTCMIKFIKNLSCYFLCKIYIKHKANTGTIQNLSVSDLKDESELQDFPLRLLLKYKHVSLLSCITDLVFIIRHKKIVHICHNSSLKQHLLPRKTWLQAHCWRAEMIECMRQKGKLFKAWNLYSKSRIILCSEIFILVKTTFAKSHNVHIRFSSPWDF